MISISSVVVGLGETGQALYDVLKQAYPDIYGYDLTMGKPEDVRCMILHICLPYQIPEFVKCVNNYQQLFDPAMTVIHSTVPIGTTTEIGSAVHSPILGDHTNMKESLTRFPKWVGGKWAEAIANYFEKAGMRCVIVEKSEETEALKLMCLAKYGMSIAFAQYQKGICDKYGFDYDHVIEWDRCYNENVYVEKKRPVCTYPGSKIGGHCVVPGTKILNDQDPNQILMEILKYGN